MTENILEEEPSNSIPPQPEDIYRNSEVTTSKKE